MDMDSLLLSSGTALPLYEGVKRYLPGLLPSGSTDEQKSFVAAIASGALLKVLGVASFAAMSWPMALVMGALSVIPAALGHDYIVKPMFDPLLNKLPGQTPKAGVQ